MIGILSFQQTIAQKLSPVKMAQILLEDSIDSLKRNDMKGALLHLNFSSQQLEAGVNSTAIQTVRILIDDAALWR